MQGDGTEALAAARDLDGFVEACREVLRRGGNEHVTYLRGPLRHLLPLVERARPLSWDWELRDPEGPLPGRWHDIAFSSALNGGYFHRPGGGPVTQWEVGGSGSQALMQWLAGIRRDGLLPGVDHFGIPFEGARYLDLVLRALAGVPYAAERFQVFREFAAKWPWAGEGVLDALSEAPDGKLEGKLELRHVDMLAHAFPEGFGADPFRKKACLAIMLLASHLAARGHRVEARIPVPSDYQVPRIMAWAGAIVVSPGLRAALLKGDLLEQGCPEVTQFRAAAVVACHDLGQMAGAPDWMVDCALFGPVRANQDFRANSLPPMRIRGMWF